MPAPPETADVGSRPWILVVLAVAGLLIAADLAAFQLGLTGPPWEPLFGDGSRRVLTSDVSRLLPVPDAAVGAVAYAVDAGLASILLARPRGATPVAVGLALIATLGAATAIGLTVLQIVVVGAFCTLCLGSAAISIALAIGAVAETRRRLRDDRSSQIPSREVAS